MCQNANKLPKPKPSSEQLAALGLKAQLAYVSDPEPKERSNGALRQARHREKKAAMLLAEINEVGEFDEFFPTKYVEVEVPAQLTGKQNRHMKLGEQVDSYTGIKRFISKWLFNL